MILRNSIVKEKLYNLKEIYFDLLRDLNNSIESGNVKGANNKKQEMENLVSQLQETLEVLSIIDKAIAKKLLDYEEESDKDNFNIPYMKYKIGGKKYYCANGAD